MARCRSIKPGFMTNEQLPEFGAHCHLFYACLWMVADRDGRLEDRPKKIKLECMPAYDVDVNELLEMLASGADPFIVRYSVGDKRYIQIVKWKENQSPHHTEKESVIPAPPLSHREVTVTSPPTRVVDTTSNQLPVTSKSVGGSGGKVQVTAASVPVPESLETPEVRTAIGDWLEYKSKRGKPYKDAGFLGRKVAEFARAGPTAFVAAVNSSIGNNYDGLFPAKDFNGNSQQTTRPNHRYVEETNS